MDAIIINQCDRTGFHRFVYKEYTIEWYDTQTRGVGISRNLAILHASADILLFADDDMVYKADAAKKIEEAFQQNPSAALIAFNIDNEEKIFLSNKRLRLYSAMGFGTYRYAVRRDILLKNRIMFSLLFGGGATYSCGEDTIFIVDFFKRKLKCYSCTSVIGANTHGESTWFKGYSEKFCYDKGVLMRQIFGTLGIVPLVALLIKHPEWAENIGKKKMFESALSGWKLFQ